jgi:peptidoglycan/xylan/chitin deacetylase (PgdA/CDA1 family)
VLRSGSSRDFSSSDDKVLSFMSWQDIREIVEQGFEVGSHTMEHAILSRLSTDTLDRELRHSKTMIESQTGRECKTERVSLAAAAVSGA